MLERLNGDEKGDAIVSVRGYEPIWSRFTPSYELKNVYFAAGKADMTKKEGRLFDKRKYVFDILGGSQIAEEERMLGDIEKKDEEDAKVILAGAEKHKKMIDDLDSQWKAIKYQLQECVKKASNSLNDEDAEALLSAPPEDKLFIIMEMIERYPLSEQMRLQKLADKLQEDLPRMKELQEKAKV